MAEASKHALPYSRKMKQIQGNFTIHDIIFTL